MGARWFKGSYDERIVIVEVHSDECARDCWAIGLVQVNDPFANDGGFTQRTNSYLAPGITSWHEKPDHAAILRRQQREAEEKQAEVAAAQQEQQAADRAAMLAHDEAMAALERADHEAADAQEKAANIALAAQQEAIGAALASAQEQSLTREQESIDQAAQRLAEARERRLSQLAVLNATREQSQEQVDARVLDLEQELQRQNEALAAALGQYEEKNHAAAIAERIEDELWLEVEEREAVAQEQQHLRQVEQRVVT